MTVVAALVRLSPKEKGRRPTRAGARVGVISKIILGAMLYS